MSGIRQAVVLGAIPIVVGLLYLGLQVANGQATEWVSDDGSVFDAAGNLVADITGTMDPAGVVLLIALGLAMGFGMLVILRGARDV